MHLKKSHYGILAAIPILFGVFVVYFDVVSFTNPEGIFSVSALNPFQTYKVNNICEFSELYFSLEILRRLPTSPEDFKEKYPEEFAVITKYRGSTDSEITQYNNMLALGYLPDELRDVYVSLVMKSNSINPNLEPLVRDLIYSSVEGKSTQWAQKFVIKLSEDGKECSGDSDPIESAMNEILNIKLGEKVDTTLPIVEKEDMPLPIIEKIAILGYDARDLNELKAHDGIISIISNE